jgi:hypothetical protein
MKLQGINNKQNSGGFAGMLATPEPDPLPDTEPPIARPFI